MQAPDSFLFEELPGASMQETLDIAANTFDSILGKKGSHEKIQL
jgi:hypothetical protein